jgi:hypothetical protein
MPPAEFANSVYLAANKVSLDSKKGVFIYAG